MNYRRKPIVVEAVQYKGHGNFDNPALPDWIWKAFEDKSLASTNGQDPLILKTSEEDLIIEIGDFLFQGPDGLIFPCKPYIFQKTYEAVVEEARRDKEDEKEFDIAWKLSLTRNKPFFVDTFRKLLNQYGEQEISLSKFVEVLNVTAYKWAETPREEEVDKEDESGESSMVKKFKHWLDTHPEEAKKAWEETEEMRRGESKGYEQQKCVFTDGNGKLLVEGVDYYLREPDTVNGENWAERMEKQLDRDKELGKKQGVFSEQTLRDEIAKVWGEHGAHMDVYNELLKRKHKEDEREQGHSLVTDEEINAVWQNAVRQNASFGNGNKRLIILDTLERLVRGFATRHTAVCIVEELKLIDKKNHLTWRGLEYLKYTLRSPNQSKDKGQVPEESDAIQFVEWIETKTGLWFDDDVLLWNLPDYNVEEWRNDFGQGFPDDQFRFTTQELYTIFKQSKQ